MTMSAKISFEKYCATGNDFVVLDNRTNSFDPKDSELWQKVCDRRFGVGADGVLFFNNSNKFDFEMVYLNADGGEVGMCGNGARALTTFAQKIQFDKDKFTFKTKDGVYSSKILKNGEVKLEMVELKDIEKIDVSDLYENSNSFYMNTGVPHSVYFIESVKDVRIVETGKKIRFDQRFDGGCNVNFVEILEKGRLKVRTYERGVEDETFACGTGAVACAIAYRKFYREESKVEVQVPGGTLNILFEGEKVYLCGKASKIFSGVINIEE